MIHLTKEQFDDIVNHAKQEYPKEACGILAGKIVHSQQSIVNSQQSKLVTKVYKMVNISENPETCYFMKPEEQLKVFKEMRNLGIEMLGIYHSHSSSPAYPSQRDCELAFYPDAYYVIISLEDFDDPEVHAFKITPPTSALVPHQRPGGGLVGGKIEEEKIIVRKNILFVCIENSCRSQIAEAIVNNFYWQKFVAYSTGSKPSGIVNPRAIEVMKEIGIDISKQKSKGFDEVKDIEFDYVITMGCGDECPSFVQRSTFNVQRLNWDIPDPKDKPIGFFREIKDEIQRKIEELIRWNRDKK